MEKGGPALVDGAHEAGGVRIPARRSRVCVMGGRRLGGGGGRFGEGVISERVTVWRWKEAKRGGKGILCLRGRPSARGTGSDKWVSLYTILIAVNLRGQVQQENIIRLLVGTRRMGETERDTETEREVINNSVAR